MATQAAKSAGGAENKNNGTIVGMQAADAVTGSALSSKGLNELATGSEYGSKVEPISQSTGNRKYSPTNATDSVGITTATAGVGTSMAFTPKPTNRTATDPQFIIRGVSTTISGSGNTALQVVGREYGGINVTNPSKSTKRIGKYSDTSIDVLEPTASGLFPYRTKGTGAGNLVSWVNPSGDGLVPVGTFDDVFATRTKPGDVVYMQGSPTPKQDDYKRRDLREGT